MTSALIEARNKAQQLWGKCGGATYGAVSGTQVLHVVGLTSLDARLGGRIAERLGVSWKSFDDAFLKAEENGHGSL